MKTLSVHRTLQLFDVKIRSRKDRFVRVTGFRKKIVSENEYFERQARKYIYLSFGAVTCIGNFLRQLSQVEISSST